MYFIIAITISSCKKYNKKNAINYIRDNYTDIVIGYYLKWNYRYRIRDWFDYRVAQKIKDVS